jgi:hypothetical protein
MPIPNLQVSLVDSGFATPKKFNISGPLFHFVHISGDETFRITQMRVVESVFYHHPDAHVKLHVPQDSSINKTRFEPLLARGYHLAVEYYEFLPLINEYMDMTDMSTGEPLSITDKNATRHWIQTVLPKLSSLKAWYADVSDLLRLLFLYMQGGTYMDTDLILVNPLPNNTNFMAWQWRNRKYANSAVLRFDQGNAFIRTAISVFFIQGKSNSDDWGVNGPSLVSKVLNENYTDCAFGKTYHPAGASNVSEPQQCPVSVLPTKQFYPILYRLQAKKELFDKDLVRNNFECS